MEKAVALLLKATLPTSYAYGLKPLSLTRWHIEALCFKHPSLGNYQAKDVFFDLKIWPLILGKCHLESLVIKDLEILQDPSIPLDLKIFNSLYQNRSFLVSKLHISSFVTSILPHSVSINFWKKPNLNFLEIYDSVSASHGCFEIINHSPFLKFQSDIVIDLPQDSMIYLKGLGSIKDQLTLDLSGACGFSGMKASHLINLNATFDKSLTLEGFLRSQNILGSFSIQDTTLKASINFKELEKLFPHSDLSGDVGLKMSGPLSSLQGSITSNKLYMKRKALAPLAIDISSFKNSTLLFEGFIKENTKNQIITNGKVFFQNSHLFSEISLKSKPFEAFLKGCFSKNSTKELLVEAKINNFSFFDSLFEKLNLSGQGNLILKYDEKNHSMELFSHLNNTRIGPYFCDKGVISFLNEGQKGHLKLELNKVTSPYLEPFNLSINADKDHHWDGLFYFKNKVAELSGVGLFDRNNDHTLLKIEDIKGTISNQPLILSSCIDILKTNDHLKISPFTITCDQMKISCAFQREKKYATINHLSLEGFKLPYFDASIEGRMNCSLEILDKDKSFFDLSISDLKLKDPTSTFVPMHLHAKCEHDEKKQMMSYLVNTFFSSDDYLFAQGFIPMTLSQNLTTKILPSASHHFMNFKYDLKDLGRIINMGAASLGGRICADLNFHGPMNLLKTFGHINVDELHAGFPLLGIYLDQGHLDIRPQGDVAEFKLKISDLDSGSGSSQGTINLKDLSYKATCQLEKFFVTFKRIFSCKTSGLAQVEGDFKHINAKGDLHLEKSGYELSHPEIKKSLSYNIEKIAKDLPIKPKSFFKYDLYFDLSTDEACKIKGIGLDSDWEGQSLCHIANSLFSLKGTLKCKKGEYKFNTKKFNIDEGIIHLEDNGPSTILAKGTLEIPNYQIKVNLIGPLSAPSLQFSSLPYLSENAIFSYILFNKPISELHPFQSIELAQTLMELSGNKSPVSLSKIRSNLSIDALDIRTSDYDQNKISLHVGKYITPSFLVGLNQTTNASDLLLQLELKHGFILKAESQEQKEGKLSFKWRKSF